MAKADLKQASAALQSLKNNPEALKNYDTALTALRHDVGVNLDDTTFKYVVNALNNQRVTDGVDPIKVGERTQLPGGFQILAAIKAQ